MSNAKHSSKLTSPRAQKIRTHRAQSETPALPRLGRALNAHAGDVVTRIVAASEAAGLDFDEAIEQRFRRIGDLSTQAVAGWMSGDDLVSARKVGLEVCGSSSGNWQLSARRA
jgi:hypothetical protein